MYHILGLITHGNAAVAPAFEEMRTLHASGREICVNTAAGGVDKTCDDISHRPVLTCCEDNGVPF